MLLKVSASGIILFLFWFGCKGVACNEYPADCVPPNSNDTSVNKTYNAIYDSILYISSNETIFAGHNVTFEIVVNKSGIDTSLSLKIIAFVDGFRADEETGPCSSNKTTEQTSLVCTLTNVFVTRSVRFLIVTSSASSPVLHFCQPPSVVFIKEELPSTVTILNETKIRCEGISFTFGVVSDGARIVCNVYNTSDGRSPLYSNSSCDNSTVVPPKVFKNHTVEYKLIVYSVKNGAKGNESNMTFSLLNEGLKFSIVEVSVDLMEGNFVATLIVKINESCPLTIPNYFFISSTCSNCSNNKQQELISNKFLGHHSLYYNQLESQKKNCVLFIEDSGGNKLNYTENLSSFHTRDFILQTVSNNTTTIGICYFLPHSPVDGCQVNITGDTMNVPIIQNITRNGNSLLASDEIVTLNPGQYLFQVTDWINGSTNSSKIAFKTTLIVPSVTSSSVSSSTTAANTSTSITPEIPSQMSESGHCEGAITGLAVLGTLAVVIQFVVIVILCLKKRKQYSVKKHDSARFTPNNGNGEDQVHIDSVPNEEANGHCQGDNILSSGQALNGTEDSANPLQELNSPIESGNQHTPPTVNLVPSVPASATDDAATSTIIPTVRPESETKKGLGSQIVQLTSYVSGAKGSTDEEYSTPSAIGEFTMEPTKNKYIPPDKNPAGEAFKNSSMISALSDASESTPFIPTSGRPQ